MTLFALGLNHQTAPLDVRELSADVVAAVVADGSGNVLLQTDDGNPGTLTAGDVVLNAAVSSTSGHITIGAEDDVDQNANISTGLAGTILVSASNGCACAATASRTSANCLRTMCGFWSSFSVIPRPFAALD